MVSEKTLKNIAILTGTTAAGKTELALQFARQHPEIEIINADSILVYRQLNIGSAKPTAEERQGITHHLIDTRDLDQPYNAGDFHRDCQTLFEDIHSRGKRALLVGGTGFYLKGLMFGSWGSFPTQRQFRVEMEKLSNAELFDQLYLKDPEWALKVSQGDRYRLIRGLEVIHLSGKTPSQLDAEMPSQPDPRFQLLVVDRPNPELFQRIEARTQNMLDNLWIEETQKLLKLYPDTRALDSVGYLQICRYLRNESPEGRVLRPGLLGLQDEINLATRQLVKKQRTWFKSQSYAQRFILDKDASLLFESLGKIYA